MNTMRVDVVFVRKGSSQMPQISSSPEDRFIHIAIGEEDFEMTFKEYNVQEIQVFHAL